MLDDSEFSLSFHPLMLMDDDTSHSLSILKKKERDLYVLYFTHKISSRIFLRLCSILLKNHVLLNL